MAPAPSDAPGRIGPLRQLVKAPTGIPGDGVSRGRSTLAVEGPPRTNIGDLSKAGRVLIGLEIAMVLGWRG